MSVTAQSGDWCIAGVAIDDSAAVITWPGAFAQQAVRTLTFGDGQRLFWATQIAGGAEPASYTFGMSSGADAVAFALAYSGQNATPLDVSATSNAAGSNGGTPFNVLALGLAAGSANRLILMIGGVDNNGTAGSIVSAAPGGGWTERVDISSGGFANIAVYESLDAPGTYTSNTTAVQTLATATGEWGAFQLALRAA